MDPQFVFFCPLHQFCGSQPTVPQVCQLLHQQTETRGGPQRVNQIDASVRITRFQHLLRGCSRIHDPGNARGEAEVDYIHSRFQKILKINFKLIGINLCCFRVCTILHGLIKIVIGQGFSEIVPVKNAIHLVGIANIGDISLFQIFLGEIHGGLTAQYICAHWLLTSCSVLFGLLRAWSQEMTLKRLEPVKDPITGPVEA